MKEEVSKGGHSRGGQSKGMMDSLMVSTFCERINSWANLVCTKNTSLLSDDEIDMVVTLPMNSDVKLLVSYPLPSL